MYYSLDVLHTNIYIEKMKPATRGSMSTLEIVSYGNFLAVVPIFPVIENKKCNLEERNVNLLIRF